MISFHENTHLRRKMLLATLWNTGACINEALVLTVVHIPALRHPETTRNVIKSK
ncbi:hypothetical protein QUQ76_004830 [Escherichia coli]|nr:hypothetical protein [Escherichia coli]